MAARYCVSTALCPDCRAATRKSTASLVRWLTSSNFIVFPFCRCRLVFFFTEAAAEKNKPITGERDRTEGDGGWQGVSESAESAKRGWASFGAKPAQSETTVR